MRTLVMALSLAVLVCASTLAAAPENPDAILGTWVTQTGKAHIEVSKTDAGVYEGKIVWLKDQVYAAGDPEEGKTVHDRENPDKAKRERPVLGLVVLQGVKGDGPGKYSGGTIYDPEEGKAYKCNITVTGPDSLKLRGFIGISLLGRTEEWTRLK